MTTQPHYYSFIEQATHYFFDRPHEQQLTVPLQSPAAWRGKDMPGLEGLAYQLKPQEVEEIQHAVSRAIDSGRPTLELTALDFPLPCLQPQIAQWRQEIMEGAGFQVIRGVPVQQWTQREAELFFWCFGLHLGKPGQQNPEGHLLGHVKDLKDKSEDPTGRLYKTAENIDYHCDGADVVGLLCLNKALEGGKSRIVSSVSVFNELVSRRPDLASRLFQPLQLDIRDKEVDEVGSTLPIQPCCYANGQLRTFYHSDYFKSATRHSEVPPLTAQEEELFKVYESIANEPGMFFDMDLQPGDIQLLSNHTNLHARTQYKDHEDTSKRRHLLRLWLSL